MTTIKEHRPASSAGKAAAVLLIAVAGFQGLLAAGAPGGVISSKQHLELIEGVAGGAEGFDVC